MADDLKCIVPKKKFKLLTKFSLVLFPKMLIDTLSILFNSLRPSDAYMRR